ncbi:MAG TPA: NAD(+)/NADH kinase [Burkholderiales bacterium]|jgi:NAD+ kinase|nr:NAD(+)/NADH kinase [Burkholderiales bacterium]
MGGFRRIALIGKLPSAGIAADVLPAVRELTNYFRSRGCEVLVEQHTAQALGVRGADYEALGQGSDLAVVVGGDGAMLAAARNLVRHHVPVVGVNQGRVGFMTDIAQTDMKSGIGAILDGKGTLEERTLLDAEILRGGAAVLRTIALNEAVLGKGAEARLIEFEVSLDGEYLYTLRADGLIVATPTGSTAYAMSAQGPILHPAVPAFALVPLNPHTLSARPVSVSDRSAIEIKLLRGVDVRAHFDGFSLTDMAEGDRLVLKRSADTVRLVHPPGYRYFATLREKLRWSEVLDKGRE